MKLVTSWSRTEGKRGMALSPHAGDKVAGRWVLFDGEVPVLSAAPGVPPS